MTLRRSQARTPRSSEAICAAVSDDGCRFTEPSGSVSSRTVFKPSSDTMLTGCADWGAHAAAISTNRATASCRVGRRVFTLLLLPVRDAGIRAFEAVRFQHVLNFRRQQEFAELLREKRALRCPGCRDSVDDGLVVLRRNLRDDVHFLVP